VKGKAVQVLYKYLKRKYAEPLVCRGTIRLGSLQEYQDEDEERHGTVIGDREEGVKRLYDDPAFATAETLSPFASPIVHSVIHGVRGPGVAFVNCVFTQEYVSANCWLYCTSARLSAQLMKEFGCDACVRLDDPATFFEAIFNELKRRGRAHGCKVFDCIYRERNQHYSADDGVHPAALKDPRYASQREVRAAFFPVNLPIERFLDVTVPELTRCCTLLDRVPD
jgi:hypothetical protein